MQNFSCLTLFCLTLCGSLTSCRSIGDASTSGLKDTADLRVGDVLLLPLDCDICTLIEEEEGSIYSHSGILLANQEGELIVAEALGKVKTVSLKEFIGRAEAGQSVGIFRHKELDQIFDDDPEGFNQLVEQLHQHFEAEFLSAPFDGEYLWDNRNASHVEKYYCTEFVYKLLNRILTEPLNPRPMSFEKNRAEWVQYFKILHRLPPDGLPGASPGDVEHSPSFIKVGDL